MDFDTDTGMVRPFADDCLTKQHPVKTAFYQRCTPIGADYVEEFLGSNLSTAFDDRYYTQGFTDATLDLGAELLIPFGTPRSACSSGDCSPIVDTRIGGQIFHAVNPVGAIGLAAYWTFLDRYIIGVYTSALHRLPSAIELANAMDRIVTQRAFRSDQRATILADLIAKASGYNQLVSDMPSQNASRDARIDWIVDRAFGGSRPAIFSDRATARNAAAASVDGGATTFNAFVGTLASKAFFDEPTPRAAKCTITPDRGIVDAGQTVNFAIAFQGDILVNASYEGAPLTLPSTNLTLTPSTSTGIVIKGNSYRPFECTSRVAVQGAPFFWSETPGKKWRLFSGPGGGTAGTSCQQAFGAGWRIPTSAEVSTAVAHGLVGDGAREIFGIGTIQPNTVIPVATTGGPNMNYNVQTGEVAEDWPRNLVFRFCIN